MRASPAKRYAKIHERLPGFDKHAVTGMTQLEMTT